MVYLKHGKHGQNLLRQRAPRDVCNSGKTPLLPFLGLLLDEGPLDAAALEHMADGTSERAVPAGEVVAAQDALATEVRTKEGRVRTIWRGRASNNIVFVLGRAGGCGQEI